jgi:putative flippase GtrA
MTQSTSPYARPIRGTLRRSALIGAIVVALDVLLLGVFVEDFGLSLAVANIPALGLGLAFAFFGNKYFAFRDRSRSVGRQGVAFALVAAAAIALNAALFHFFGPMAGLGWVAARVLSSTLTYFGFAYRLSGQIFHASRTAHA